MRKELTTSRSHELPAGSFRYGGARTSAALVLQLLLYPLGQSRRLDDSQFVCA